MSFLHYIFTFTYLLSIVCFINIIYYEVTLCSVLQKNSPCTFDNELYLPGWFWFICTRALLLRESASLMVTFFISLFLHTKLESGVAKFPVTDTQNANTSVHIITQISNNIMQEVYVQKHCILIA